MTQINNEDILASFGLESSGLDLGQSHLTALEAVRHVPFRRCVCRALWQSQAVYAKLFFGKKAHYYASRDMEGVVALQKAGLLTPKVLYHGEVNQPLAYVIVFEAIEGSQNVEDVWIKSNEADRLNIAKKIVNTVAAHHEANLMQTDLYLKNFLLKQGLVYTIDGDGIRTFSNLSRQKALQNLSRLLSKFDVLMLDRHLSTLLDVYADARAWKESPDIMEVKKYVNLARFKATFSYTKKVFRQCTDVNVIKRDQLFIAIRSHYALTKIPLALKALDSLFTPENILKAGNTCTVSLVAVDELCIVIKRYNIKSFWHGLRRALRKSRAAASWANAHRLKLLEIETANPIALIESKPFGVNRRAYFLTEFVDAPDAVEFFKQTPSGYARSTAVKELVQLLYKLHLLHISHGDMKATNIKLLANSRPLLIDLDSMKQHKRSHSADKAHIKDIKRFMQNWKDEPSLYNAFVKVFKVVYADHALLYAAKILE